jgi:hypothetical protein
VCSSTLPTADHVLALGYEVGRAPEIDVRKTLSESHHEVAYILPTASGRMQRILKQHVGCREFIDDLGIPGVTSEPLEPTADVALLCCSSAMCSSPFA